MLDLILLSLIVGSQIYDKKIREYMVKKNNPSDIETVKVPHIPSADMAKEWEHSLANRYPLTEGLDVDSKTFNPYKAVLRLK
jgi:hypothetical protein